MIHRSTLLDPVEEPLDQVARAGAKIDKATDWILRIGTALRLIPTANSQPRP
jgi:hypothetical protein